MLDKAIWKCSTPEQKCVLTTVLLMANHEPNQWVWDGEKFEVKEGQFITSLRALSEKAGVSVQNVRSALVKLEKAEFLTNESTKTGRLISIVNWSLYQPLKDIPNKEVNKEVTKSQQRGNKEPTTNNNDNNDKNDKNNIYSVHFQKFWSAYPRKVDKKNAYKCYLARLNEGYTEEELLIAAENYAKECKKEKRDTKYIKHATTFLSVNTPFEDYIKGGEDNDDNTTKPEYTDEQLKAFMQSV